MAQYEQRDFAGSLFRNEKKETDKHPDAKGKAMIGGVMYWVSAWTKTSGAGQKYWSLSFQKMDKQPDSAKSDPIVDVAKTELGGVVVDDLPF